MKTACLCLSFFLSLGFAAAVGTSPSTSSPTPSPRWTTSKGSYSPPNGCVPDAKTAFKIADAILQPIYGEKELEWNKPFAAELRKGVWTVGGMGNHPGIEGGGMEIDIAKSDGRILRIYAGQ